MSKALRQLTFEVDLMAIYIKMLETQIAQRVSSSSKPRGMFPRKPNVNLNVHYTV